MAASSKFYRRCLNRTPRRAACTARRSAAKRPSLRLNPPPAAPVWPGRHRRAPSCAGGGRQHDALQRPTAHGRCQRGAPRVARARAQGQSYMCCVTSPCEQTGLRPATLPHTPETRTTQAPSTTRRAAVPCAPQSCDAAQTAFSTPSPHMRRAVTRRGRRAHPLDAAAGTSSSAVSARTGGVHNQPE